MSQYYTSEKLAEHLSVSIGTIQKWVSTGFIPADTYINSGKVYRFNLEAVEKAILGKQMDLGLEDVNDPRRFYRPKGEQK